MPKKSTVILSCLALNFAANAWMLATRALKAEKELETVKSKNRTLAESYNRLYSFQSDEVKAEMADEIAYLNIVQHQ